MTGAAAMIRACRGPLVLIALGALTAADTFGTYSLTRTWPVLLILFGLLKLAEKAAESRDTDGPGSYPQGPAAYAGYPPQGGYSATGGFSSPVPNEPIRPAQPPAAATPTSSVDKPDAPKIGDGQ